jgi:hypothetical protein
LICPALAAGAFSGAMIAARYRPAGSDFQSENESMSTLIGVLITFLVIILVLYLINMLPLDGRAKQIAQIVVIIIGVISLLKYLAVF